MGRARVTAPRTGNLSATREAISADASARDEDFRTWTDATRPSSEGRSGAEEALGFTVPFAAVPALSRHAITRRAYRLIEAAAIVDKFDTVVVKQIPTERQACGSASFGRIVGADRLGRAKAQPRPSVK